MTKLQSLSLGSARFVAGVCRDALVALVARFLAIELESKLDLLRARPEMSDEDDDNECDCCLLVAAN